MKQQAMIETMKKGKYDIFHTPIEGILPVIDYIPPKCKTIWECCDAGNSLITQVLKEHNYNVISTDVVTGFDFLKDTPNFEFDCILTNPPFSIKDKFIARCYEFKKPFALLMPITALEGVFRQSLYRQYGINILLLKRRVDFMKINSGAWFAVAWFIYYTHQENNKIFYSKNELSPIKYYQESLF